MHALVWRTITTIDKRGNAIVSADPSNPTEVSAAFIPQRGSRAEIAGQQIINVTRMILDADTPDVGLWNKVEWNGKVWDVVAPAQYHNGSRQTRHVSVDIRERP